MEKAKINNEETGNGDAYRKEAEKTTNIVEASIEQGDFSEAIEKLDRVLSESEDKNQYVFGGKKQNKYGEYLLSLVLMILSISYIYFLFLCVGTLIYSETYKFYAILGTAVLAILFVTNVWIIIRRRNEIKFQTRYNLYYNDLRFKSIELIEDLAVYAKQSPKKVIDDLKKAVRYKLIPQGHFGSDDVVFMVSDEIYECYMSKQAVYDRYYRKQVEERLRLEERSEDIQDILDQGQGYIKKIHESNDIIKDKAISEKLNRLEKVVSMIFHEVDVNPNKADTLGMFMNYYLPTTEKLLTSYIDLNEKEIQGQTIKSTKKEIEEVLDKIIESFESLLDKFYQEQQMDISTDISTLETMLKQEGLSQEKILDD